MSCKITINRTSLTNATAVLTAPVGYVITGVNIAGIHTLNCTIQSLTTSGFNITVLADRASVWFDDDAITIARGIVSFAVGVEGAEESSPLQVPLSCIACDNTQITAGARTRLIKGRATAGGPGPDVRIVARRRWGDDFAGCNTCNDIGVVSIVYPTITLTTNSSQLSINQTATITATVSESAVGFTLSDIVAQGGTVSTLQQTGPLTYTFIFTATMAGSATINVPPNSFTTSAGVPNLASNIVSITVSGPPTITLSSSSESLIYGQTATITATVSEPTSNFNLSDINYTGGTIAAFTVTADPLVYTCTFTPPNFTSVATIRVLAGAFTNSAGVPNLASNILTINIISRPTVVLSAASTSVATGGSTTITATLSAASTNFDINDIVIGGGGSLGPLSQSGLIYTCTFTASQNASTTLLFVLEDSFTNSAGVGNIISNTLSITVY
jgi:hypothetical protein